MSCNLRLNTDDRTVADQEGSMPELLYKELTGQ